MKLTDLNRYQAFASHMVISLVIFFILLVFITQIWYPGILFDAGNGWKAIGLIVGVDLILGPILTLIVFNPKKSSLIFDLSVIALLQIAALSYGAWTIYQTRPIALAFINTSFVTIFANSEWAEEVHNNIRSENTNLFFYVFDANNSKSNLVADQLKPYQLHSNTVLTIESPYKENGKINDDGTITEVLIRLDSLITTDSYIKLNKNDGSIIGYVKK
jgi:hypothetical protein